MARIAVVGPGALGCLFAGLLAQHGHDVVLVCRGREAADRLARSGVAIERDGEVRRAAVWTYVPGDPAGPVDAVLVLVKSFDTDGAARAVLPLLRPDTVVATLQNGLGNAEQLAAVLGADRVLAGATSQGANLVDVGRVRHAGFGPTHLTEMVGGAGPRALWLAALLTRAGIETHAAEELGPVAWAKLIANVAINPLTALTGLRNGELLDVPATASLLDELASEAGAVARAVGVSLPFDDPVAHCRRVAEVTRRNRSSMLQDVERRRRTEIDAINGAVLALARQHGVPAPTTGVIYRVIKGVESGYLTVAPDSRPGGH